MRMKDLQLMIDEIDEVLSGYGYRITNKDFSQLPAKMGFVAMKKVDIIPNGPIGRKSKNDLVE